MVDLVAVDHVEHLVTIHHLGSAFVGGNISAGTSHQVGSIARV